MGYTKGCESRISAWKCISLYDSISSTIVGVNSRDRDTCAFNGAFYVMLLPVVISLALSHIGDSYVIVINEEGKVPTTLVFFFVSTVIS